MRNIPISRTAGSFRSGPAAALLRAVLAMAKCSRAAISPLTALMLIPISGAIAYSVELGSWQYMQRSMQNAADTAALAAATNNTTTGVSTYVVEARAAAKQMGYADGVNNVTVMPERLTTGCPGGAGVCYKVTVSTVFPLMFSKVVGFSGDSSGGLGQSIQSVAIAVAAGGGVGTTTSACVWALSASNNAFVSNGGPKPDMSGCSLLSNGGMTCNGHNLGADYGIAAGTSSGCGAHQVSNATMPADPYAALAPKIPSNSCSSYPQLDKGKVPSSNEISGSFTGVVKRCGDTQLKGDVTLTGTNTTFVVYNGRLDLNGYTMKTASGASATIIFSGDNTTTYSHYPMSSKNKSGTLDIQAPTSGDWAGIAMYQDPALTKNVSFTYAGNEPTWNITGLVYLPKADLTFSGAVNKSASGASCFVLVAYTVQVNGTAYIYGNTTGCGTAGVTVPSVTIGGGTTTREKLVL